jgi:hypothetical protein
MGGDQRAAPRKGSGGMFIEDVVRNTKAVSIGCVIYIVAYYVVTHWSLRAARQASPKGWLKLWKKNGALDIATSVIWLLGGVILVWSLMALSRSDERSVGLLALYYGYFILIFAFCYCIVEWHFGNSLEGVNATTWRAQLQYLLVSTETQTMLGYCQVKPKRLLSEGLAAVQALLGLFFVVVFVAEAVERMR